jgi:Tol biopolymer transport system component
MRSLLAATVLLAALAGAGADRGVAAYPGGNGRIAFLSDHGTGALGLFTMRADGTGVRRLSAPAPFADYPAPSPEGAWIAFVRVDLADYGTELWVARRDGTRLHRLVAGLGTMSEVAWSADGRWIAFVDDRRGAGGIFAVAPNGRRLHRLVPWPASSPAWAADGRLAFAGRDGIYVQRPGSRARRVLRDAGDPAWSPDGRRLAFTRYAGILPHLYVANADGTRAHRLPAPASRCGEDAPDWSPDGRWILLATCLPWDELTTVAAVVRPNGRAFHHLFRADVYNGRLAWTDRGSGVVYSDPGEQIQLVRRDGSRRHPLFAGPPGDSGPPTWLPDGELLTGCTTWAPDGRRCAYADDQDGISVTDLDANTTTTILEGDGHDGPSMFAPSWSPDGRTIAYAAGDGSSGELALYDLASGRTQSLGQETTGAIDWSPDGRRLVYDDGGSVFAVDVATGQARRLLANAQEAAWSPDGTLLAFVRGRGTGAELWLARIDGTHQLRLTHDRCPDRLPDWQPLPR